MLFADNLLNRLHNIVANFDTFIFNIKIVMIIRVALAVELIIGNFVGDTP